MTQILLRHFFRGRMCPIEKSSLTKYCYCLKSMWLSCHGTRPSMDLGKLEVVNEKNFEKSRKKRHDSMHKMKCWWKRRFTDSMQQRFCCGKNDANTFEALFSWKEVSYRKNPSYKISLYYEVHVVELSWSGTIHGPRKTRGCKLKKMKKVQKQCS